MCPELSSPDNGTLNLSTNGLVTVASFTCDIGSSLAGSPQLTCNTDGSWDSREPDCGKVLRVIQTFLSYGRICLNLNSADLDQTASDNRYFNFCNLFCIIFEPHCENMPMQYIENFSADKIENFIGKNLIFLIFLLKTLIAGTRQNHLAEVVLMSTHNQCFKAKTGIPLNTPVLLYKSGD